MSLMRAIMSERDIPLHWSEEDGLVVQIGRKTIVTVEDYTKWYDLYLVSPFPGDPGASLVIRSVAFPDEPTSLYRPCYVDHVPNPLAVEEWAEKNGYEICEAAFERMVGRWYIEVVGLQRAPSEFADEMQRAGRR